MDSARSAMPPYIGKYDHLVRPEGLVHRTLYTDAKIFEEEMTKIFGGTWVFLIHEGEIPKPHDFKQIKVGCRPVIMSRDANGAIHALLNRCTHRGSLVCIAKHGNARQFQCPYHTWTFGSDGKLLGIPYPAGNRPGFNEREYNLGRLPRVESYRGYVFGSLNPDVEPLVEWLGNARPILDWSVDKEAAPPERIRVVPGTHYTFRANWKHQNDNNADSYHVPFLHLSTARMNQRRHGTGKGLDHFKGESTPMVVQYLGNGHKLLDQRASIGSTWERARPVPGREAYAESILQRLGPDEGAKYLELVGRAGINLLLYPNLFILGHGSFAVYEPVAVDATNVHYYTMIYEDGPEEINVLRVRFTEDFANVGIPDDNEAMERVQYAITTIPEMEWLDFSRGFGTDRETVGPDGVVTGNIMDETAVRGSYFRWKELMNRDVCLKAI